MLKAYALSISLALISTVHASAQEKGMADLVSDFSNLSPRTMCLEGLVKDILPTRALLRDQAELEREALDPRIERTLSDFIEAPRRPGSEEQAFHDKIDSAAEAISNVAGARAPNLRRLQYLIGVMESISPNMKSTWRTQDAFARRDCVLEYVAAAYGVGATGGISRYNQRLSEWNALFENGKARYYPRYLASLNYLVARELLMSGDEKGAFALSSDPVMLQDGLKRSTFGTQWVASFYVFGIGVERSIPKAIALYESTDNIDNQVDAAILKASIGKKAEAVTQLNTVMRNSLEIDWAYKRASAAYTQITGERVKQPNLLATLLAIPIAVVAVCVQNPGLCPSSGSSTSSGYTGSTYQEQQAEWREKGRACSRRVSDLYDKGWSFELC